MNISNALYRKCFPFIVLFVTLVQAQAQKYDITPLVGARYGGTLKLEQQGVSPNVDGHLADSVSYGVSGGIRIPAEDCDACDLIEFRWMRTDTHIGLTRDLLVPPPVVTPFTGTTPLTLTSFRPAVTLDYFLGDLTHEWGIPDAPKIKPFVMMSLGTARMSTPASSSTRFVFGLGTGIKVFPKRHWGFRFQAEYLPIVMHAEVQSVVCVSGCVVALSGGLMNQFQVSFGPAFRF